MYWFKTGFTYKVGCMNWQEFTALLVLATAMSFSPGPNTTLASTMGANHGLRQAMPFVCAVPVGWGVLLGLCAVGLGALLLAVPLLAWAVKLLGVAYLLWLAAKLIGVKFQLRQLRQSPGQSGPTESTRIASPPVVTFWQGAALQFVNIKAWLLALAIVSGWIAGRSDATVRFAIVLPVMMAYAFASNLTYAMVGSLLREWLAGPNKSGRRLAWFNRLMAGVLVATAIWMFFI